MGGWVNQAYSRLSTTHGHITDCKLLVCIVTWVAVINLTCCYLTSDQADVKAPGPLIAGVRILLYQSVYWRLTVAEMLVAGNSVIY